MASAPGRRTRGTVQQRQRHAGGCWTPPSPDARASRSSSSTSTVPTQDPQRRARRAWSGGRPRWASGVLRRLDAHDVARQWGAQVRGPTRQGPRQARLPASRRRRPGPSLLRLLRPGSTAGARGTTRCGARRSGERLLRRLDDDVSRPHGRGDRAGQDRRRCVSGVLRPTTLSGWRTVQENESSPAKGGDEHLGPASRQPASDVPRGLDGHLCDRGQQLAHVARLEANDVGRRAACNALTASDGVGRTGSPDLPGSSGDHRHRGVARRSSPASCEESRGGGLAAVELRSASRGQGASSCFAAASCSASTSPAMRNASTPAGMPA